MEGQEHRHNKERKNFMHYKQKYPFFARDIPWIQRRSQYRENITSVAGWLLSMESSVEWELLEETEVIGKILLQCHFFHHESRKTQTRIEPAPQWWEPATMGHNDIQNHNI
jgi:hypothetical protein